MIQIREKVHNVKKYVTKRPNGTIKTKNFLGHCNSLNSQENEQILLFLIVVVVVAIVFFSLETNE